MDIKKTKGFITYLPPEIIIEIMARLPAQTILKWKCVCKSWRHLFETPEFAKSHMSKSVPGLALSVVQTDKNIQHTNMLDIRHHNIHLSAITKLYSPYTIHIHGSVDGLLLLQIRKSEKFELYICNPITREYIDLFHYHPQQFDIPKRGIVFYGFGASKISGQYKVVAIYQDHILHPRIIPKLKCKVYTIGTRSWRSVVVPDVMVSDCLRDPAAVVNGNVHWLQFDLNKILLISCFDLETELFTTFSLPSLRFERRSPCVCLIAVEGTLCVCEYRSVYSAMVNVWLMKEYGVEKSWKKVFVIGECRDLWQTRFYPIRISKDGIIFTAPDKNSLFYYSIKTKTIRRICNSEESVYVSSVSHLPTFLSLKRFRMENSISF